MKQCIKNIMFEILKYKTKIDKLKELNSKKDLVKKINLSKMQIEIIDDLWLKNYGKTISKDWHRLYTSYNNQFNEKYFPEIYFYTNLIHKLNPYKTKFYLADKMLTQYFFSDLSFPKVKVPTNYIYNCSGYFYTGGGVFK